MSRSLRSILVLSLISAASSPSARAADLVAGTVVDQQHQPLPRAEVRTVDASGAETSRVFADEAGRFRLTGAAGGCRVTASLTGFQPASVPCAPTLTIVLHVSPVHETVVVTATRTEAPASQVGASVTAFTADDLERRQLPLVADLLRTSPGAMVVTSGAPGGVTSLFVRGGESNYNKVLLDGIPLNEPGGTFNFSNVTTEGLDRVEIVRGAQSALFGSDAMASVVQLMTRRGDRTGGGQPRVSGVLEGGSFGTVHGNASVSGASGRTDYALGAAGITTDNQVPNNAYDNTTVFANVGIALTDRATLRVIGRGEFERTGTPGQTAFGRPDLDAFFTRHDGVVGVSLDAQNTPAFRQRASYSVSLSNQQSTNLVADPPYTPSYGSLRAPFQFSDFTYDSLTNLQRHHASYQADVRLANDASHGSQMLTLLADWDGERATITDRLANTATSPSRDNFGAAIEHQALWPRVFVTVGGRVEHNGNFGTAAVPRGSVAFVVHDGNGAVGATTIHAGAGLGIKEPTFLQSFSTSPYYLGNPDLKPERSRTIEAGIEQRLAADRLKVSATWFDNEYRDLISTRLTDPATFSYQYFNIGLTQARGLETVFEVAPHRNLRGRFGYTYLDSTIVDSTSPDSTVFAVGQPLFRRPKNSGYAGVTWSDSRLTLDLDGTIIGSYVDSDFSSFTPPLTIGGRYSTWQARAACKLTPKLTATAAVDNLTNASYMQPLGYPALSRAFRVGLRIGL